jgi:hypothetical protein
VDAGNLNVANAVQDVNVIPKDNLQQHWKADNNRIPQIDGGNQQVLFSVSLYYVAPMHQKFDLNVQSVAVRLLLGRQVATLLQRPKLTSGS